MLGDIHDFTVLCLLLWLGAAPPGSPGFTRRRLAMEFQTMSGNQPSDAGGQLVYAVTFHGKPLVEPSLLGLDLNGQPTLGASVRIVNSVASQADETYRLLTGKASTVRNHYNALRLELEEIGGSARKLVMEARAYDDGVAFRYVVPEQPGLSEFRLERERTTFRLSKDPIVYALILPNQRSMYESEFIKLSATSLANQGGVASKVLVGLPLLMDVPGTAWMAITEADLRDYAAMYLINPGGGWSSYQFECQMAGKTNETNVCVTGTLPHHSAWRVLLVGAEPGRLMDSSVILLA